MATASGGQEKLDTFVEALQSNKSQQLVFSENEALELVNKAAEVLFSGMPWVSVSCSAVSFHDNRAEVNTVLNINALHVRPRVTFTAHVSGDYVIIDVTRMRVGLFPMSVTATLAAINLAGPPPYMQVYPWQGRIIVEKRGSVAKVTEIGVTRQELRVRLGQ